MSNGNTKTTSSATNWNTAFHACYALRVRCETCHAEQLVARHDRQLVRSASFRVLLTRAAEPHNSNGNLLARTGYGWPAVVCTTRLRFFAQAMLVLMDHQDSDDSGFLSYEFTDFLLQDPKHNPGDQISRYAGGIFYQPYRFGH